MRHLPSLHHIFKMLTEIDHIKHKLLFELFQAVKILLQLQFLYFIIKEGYSMQRATENTVFLAGERMTHDGREKLQKASHVII